MQVGGERLGYTWVRVRVRVRVRVSKWVERAWETLSPPMPPPPTTALLAQALSFQDSTLWPGLQARGCARAGLMLDSPLMLFD